MASHRRAGPVRHRASPAAALAWRGPRLSWETASPGFEPFARGARQIIGRFAD
jgi:hypothetical protein